MLGLLGFCEFYFADLISSLFILSRLACCVMFDVTAALWFWFGGSGLFGRVCRVRFAESNVLSQVCWVKLSGSGLLGQVCWGWFAGSGLLGQVCWVRFAESVLLGQVNWVQICKESTFRFWGFG